MDTVETENSHNNEQNERLDKIVETMENDNVGIDEALSLLDEAIQIGNEACRRASDVLKNNE
jgi:exonuclease VII small subunit